MSTKIVSNLIELTETMKNMALTSSTTLVVNEVDFEYLKSRFPQCYRPAEDFLSWKTSIGDVFIVKPTYYVGIDNFPKLSAEPETPKMHMCVDCYKGYCQKHLRKK